MSIGSDHGSLKQCLVDFGVGTKDKSYTPLGKIQNRARCYERMLDILNVSIGRANADRDEQKLPKIPAFPPHEDLPPIPETKLAEREVEATGGWGSMLWGGAKTEDVEELKEQLGEAIESLKKYKEKFEALEEKTEDAIAAGMSYKGKYEALLREKSDLRDIISGEVNMLDRQITLSVQEKSELELLMKSMGVSLDQQQSEKYSLLEMVQHMRAQLEGERRRSSAVEQFSQKQVQSEAGLRTAMEGFQRELIIARQKVKGLELEIQHLKQDRDDAQHYRSEVNQLESGVHPRLQQALERGRHIASQQYDQTLRSRESELYSLGQRNHELSSAYESIRSRMSSLQDELEGSQYALTEYKTGETRALQQVEDLTVARDDLDMRLQQQMKMVQEEQVSVTYTRRQVLEVTTLKDDLSSKVSALENEKQQLERQTEDLTRQLSSAQTRSRSELKIRKTLGDQAGQAKKKVSELEASVKKLQVELDTSKAIKKIAWDSESGTKEQLSKIQEREKELEREISKAGQTNKQLEAELKEERKELAKHKAIVKDMDGLARVLRDQRRKALQAHIRASTAERKAERSSKEVTELQRELQSVKEANEIIDGEKRNLIHDLDATKSELRNVKTRLEQAERKAKELEARFMSEIGTAQNEVAAMEDKFTKLAAVEFERDELLTEVNERKTENAELQSVIDKVRSQASQWSEDVSRLKNQLDAMRSQNLKMELAHKQSFEELQRSSSKQIAGLKRHRDQLKDRLTESKQSIERLTTRLEETIQQSQAQVSHADSRLESLHVRHVNDVDDALSKNVDLERQVTRLKVDMDKQSREMRSTIVELQQEVASAKESHDALVEDHEKEIGELSKVNAEQRMRIEELTGNLKEVTTRLESSVNKEELNEMETEMNELRQKLRLAQLELAERQTVSDTVVSHSEGMMDRIQVMGPDGNMTERNLSSQEVEENSWRHQDEYGPRSLAPETMASLYVQPVKTRTMGTQTDINMDDMDILVSHQEINDALEEHLSQLQRVVEGSDTALQETRREHAKAIKELELKKDQKIGELQEQLSEKSQVSKKMEEQWSDASHKLMSLRGHYDSDHEEALDILSEKDRLTEKARHLSQELDSVRTECELVNSQYDRAVVTMIACAQELIAKLGAEDPIVQGYAEIVQKMMELNNKPDDESELLTSLRQ